MGRREVKNQDSVAANKAICDMLEVLHSVGKIDSETYRDQLAQHGGLDRLPSQLSAADFKAIRQKLSLSQRQLAELIPLLMGILNKNGLAVLSV